MCKWLVFNNEKCNQVLLAQDHDGMEYMTRKRKEEYEKWGLAINLEKTKYVCMGKGKEILKFDGREEIKPCMGCTYLGTKIDQSGDNTTEIKHIISQTRKDVNALNSIWWMDGWTDGRTDRQICNHYSSHRIIK